MDQSPDVSLVHILRIDPDQRSGDYRDSKDRDSSWLRKERDSQSVRRNYALYDKICHNNVCSET